MVSRATATRYLNELCETGLIEKIKVSRSYYYMNLPLIEMFTRVSGETVDSNSTFMVESISENAPTLLKYSDS